MNVSDFDYVLSPDRIAQRPAPDRDRSRLLVLDRRSGAVEHRRFCDLVGLLRRGDLLVLNDTRVIPARLIGRKPSGGRVELLLLERLDADASGSIWRCLIRASRTPAPGSQIEFDRGLRGLVLERDDEAWRLRLEAEGQVEDLLEQLGQVPLPPYIHRQDGRFADEDRERYQTVFARRPGAVAAPTAGLHFTPELLEELERAGIERAVVTLHVGLGSFSPVRVEQVEDHKMHAEWFEVSEATAEAVDLARRRGGRVVAVGTTVVRALENRAFEDGRIAAGSGHCSLFIRPGFRFRVIDALITNFHLPRSTLLMLVCAFAGRERVLAAYRDANRMDYRFYSYGDAMLVTAD